MNFALTDEQRAMRESITRYLSARFDLSAVRTVAEDAAGSGNPPALWTAIADHGWLAVLVPEAFDGLGLGLVDAQVVARTFGSALVPGPWRSSVLAGEALRLAGSAEIKTQWLPRIASGTAVAAIDLEHPLVSSGATVSGLLPAVEYAGIADALIATSSSGLQLIDPRSSGVTVTALEQYDGTTRLARVELDNVQADRLPLPMAARDELLARAAVLVAADLTGIARQALDRTVAYAKTREQFGRPIGSFQAIKHALAELHVAVTMTEHAALYAAHAFDVQLPDAAIAVSVAKAKASEVAKAASAAMIQYHGGIGFTWEHDAHLFYKRAKRLAATAGDAASHLERLARLTVDRLDDTTSPAPRSVRPPQLVDAISG